MPSLDPNEIQRLNDEGRLKATSADQGRSLPAIDGGSCARRHISGASGQHCQVIEIAHFQRRLARPRMVRGET
jgi:hypothetical protein